MAKQNNPTKKSLSVLLSRVDDSSGKDDSDSQRLSAVEDHYEFAHTPRHSLGRSPPANSRASLGVAVFDKTVFSTPVAITPKAMDDVTGSKRKRNGDNTLGSSGKSELNEKKSSLSGGKQTRKKKRQMKLTEDSEVESLSDNEKVKDLDDLEAQSTPAIASVVMECVDEIERVRITSSNLKGTYQKALKVAEDTMRTACAELAARASASTQKGMTPLKKENEKLRSYIKNLEDKLSDMEKEKQRAKKSPPTRTISEEIANLGKILNESIEKRFTAFRMEMISLIAESIKRPEDQRIASESSRKPEKLTVKEGPQREDNLNGPANANPAPWMKIGRRKKATLVPSEKEEMTPNLARKAIPSKADDLDKDVREKKIKKVKDSAVVHLIREDGCSMDFAQIMREARSEINLTELGIMGVRPRTSMSGGLLLEIPGRGQSEKALALAGRLRSLLENQKVKVSCPRRTREVILSGFDLSVTPKDIKEAIESKSGDNDDLKIGEIKRNRLGVGMVWIKCAECTAHELLKLGRLRVGWSDAKIQAVEQRPLQCFKCWNFGHTRDKCTSGTDRSTWCFKCGEKDHVIKECTATIAKCRLCEDANRSANHRMGSQSCSAVRPLRRINSVTTNRAKPEKKKNDILTSDDNLTTATESSRYPSEPEKTSVLTLEDESATMMLDGDGKSGGTSYREPEKGKK
ncbi:uncharacterized protein LOC108626572 [Ceratina calcarata]|uniref:Uncharacterized protein LOC108626572 n=1 Tax=Ceratina calcarata TaxID=156304 RepID=A0AAJ7J2V0_9HYME|nr:uncharacterized protein LOC108626572 [Ceratina calcarata]